MSTRLRCGLFAALCCLSGWAQAVLLAPDQTLLITQMAFVKSDAAEPPQTGWQVQALPDSWRTSRPGESGYGWYRVNLSLAQQPTATLGLMISLVGTTYAVYVNGVEVGDGGGMRGPIRRTGTQPQFVAIAPQALRAGDNWLHLRLRVAPNLRGGLTPVLVGPRAQVEQMFDEKYFLRVTLTRSANVALIVTGLIVGLLWLKRSRESIYGYFAALAVLWSLRNFHYTYSGAGIPSVLWEAFVLGSLGVVLMLVWLFMLRLTRQAMPRTEGAVKAVCLSMPVVFVLLGEQAMSQLRLFWYGLCVALGVAAIAVLLRHLRRPDVGGKTGPWLILAAMVLTLAFGLHDYAISANLLPYGSAAMMAYGAPLLLAALVFTLAADYFGAFDAVERLNATLERRVRERGEDLQVSYDRMADLQRSAAVAAERERLMRDIHDGVGSQLMAAKAGIERGQLDHAQAVGLINQCIDDLRLVIDSLDPEQRHAGDALATLRYRLQPRLAAAGVASVWQISAQPVPLGPGELLDLVRVVQEALTNVLKHSGAQRVWISFEADADGGWQLEIGDDGCGLPSQPAPPEGQSPGRGLANLRRRASNLRAQLSLQPHDASARPAVGTVLRLVHHAALPDTSPAGLRER